MGYATGYATGYAAASDGPEAVGRGILESALMPSVASSIDITFVRESERSYQVFADPSVDENFVRENYGVRIGDPHPTDRQQRCVGSSVRCEGQVTWGGDNSIAYRWTAVARYGPWNPMENSTTGNPVDIPARVRFEVTTVNVPAYVDVNGKPIVNSAGDYYDPPVEMENPRVTLVVSRNEAAPDPATLLALTNAVNLDAWNGFPPKTVKLACPKMPQVQYSQATGSFYWPMEYEFDINFDTWTKLILNRGYRELDDSGKLVPILINGQPVSDPCFLDEAGKAILTPDYLDKAGEAPDEPAGGYSGEPDGGGRPPESGETTAADGGSGGSGTIYPNSYETYRTHDFAQFKMDNLFRLPGVL